MQRLVVRDGPLALDDVLDLEVVHRHAPLEEEHQQRRVHRVAQVVRVPLLVLVHPQDAVTDVAVLAEDVGEGVVDVVVRVLPLVARADVVPLVHAGVQARVTHPVVLAVHHVVADLHVVEDLGDAQRRDRERPGRREVHQRAAGDLELALLLDDAADVVRVLLAELADQALADRVDLVAERLDLLGGQLVVGLLVVGLGCCRWVLWSSHLDSFRLSVVSPSRRRSAFVEPSGALLRRLGSASIRDRLRSHLPVRRRRS